jgi:hypothetical protein
VRPTQVERVQAAIDAWLAARAPIEKVIGIASYISFGAAGAIEAFGMRWPAFTGSDPTSSGISTPKAHRTPATNLQSSHEWTSRGSRKYFWTAQVRWVAGESLFLPKGAP